MDDHRDEHFVSVFVANRNRIYRFLLTVVPRRDYAEDLFQQTSLTLWRSRDKYNPAAGDFTSWACAIAHNHVRNLRRREANQPVQLSDDVVEQLIATNLAHHSLLDDLHHALAGCLDKLTPHQRLLVDRCYGGSRSVKEVAEAEGRTPNAMYKVLRHIRKVLFDCIQRTVAQGGVR